MPRAPPGRWSARACFRSCSSFVRLLPGRESMAKGALQQRTRREDEVIIAGTPEELDRHWDARFGSPAGQRDGGGADGVQRERELRHGFAHLELVDVRRRRLDRQRWPG